MSKNLILFIVLVIATVALCSPPRERRNHTYKYERYNQTRMENQTERRWRYHERRFREGRAKRHPFLFGIAAIVGIISVIFIIKKALKKIKENLYKEVKEMLMADFQKQNNVNAYQSFMGNDQMIQSRPIEYKPTVVPQDLTRSTFDRVQYLFV